MAQAAVRIQDQVPTDALEAAILDRNHLSRMTFGDRSLEREVLQLFDRQAELLMERMCKSDPAAVATLAHTLKGSAVGVGAVRVARAAATVEHLAMPGAGRLQPRHRPTHIGGCRGARTNYSGVARRMMGMALRKE